MILVIGAGGQTGQLIVEALSKTGQPVRAMVRREAQQAELLGLGASEVVVADLEGEWQAALIGCDGVIFAAGAGVGGRAANVDHLGAVSAIRALEASAGKRFVMVTSMGTTYPERLPFIEAVLREKRKAELVLEASALNWTIVRPGGLTNAPATGRVRVGSALEVGGMVPRADVAALCAAVYTDARSHGRVLEVISGDTPLAEALEVVLESR
jgi:uncharacterized protein YbjT (DUF2867 family)